MLTQDEIELIVASLSFSSTSDICAQWSEEHQHQMADLVCKLCEEHNISDIENLEIMYESEEDIDKRAETPELTKRLLEYIPLG